MSDYFRIIKKYLPPVQVRCQTFVGSFKGDKNRVSGMVLADYCKAFDMIDQVFTNDLPLHVSLCIQTSPSLRKKLGIFPEGGGDV